MQPAAPMPVHSLTDSELSRLARGRPTAATISRLIAAESSKHRLLVEAVRRQASLTQSSDVRLLLEKAIDLLSDVAAHSPRVVAALLALPQVGGWAVNCLRRMAAEKSREGASIVSQTPLSSDLGYLASIAAVAALRTRHPFEILVPLRNGALLLPSFGIANLSSTDPWGFVRVRLDGDGAVASLQNGKIPLPIGCHMKPDDSSASWLTIARLRSEADGLVLTVAFDPYDPFLGYVGRPGKPPSPADRMAWQSLIHQAWQLLARHHRAIAEALAAGVSTLVPLAGPATSFPKSVTSGWTFGAIGLSLPRDALSLAEILVHEFQHIVLGGVEDLDTLVLPKHNTVLSYAPWRDDPRPPSGLLHGCYAYLGLIAFWRRLRHVGRPQERFRSEVEFARWRLAVLEAAKTLMNSSALTETGQTFVAGICDQLESWKHDPVTREAELLAAEMRTEHRARWRLRYLQPRTTSVEALARDWLSNIPGKRNAMDSITALDPAKVSLGQTRAYLMESRYRDPERIRWLTEFGGNSSAPRAGLVLDEADAALLRGDYDSAFRCYIRRLKATSDHDAWVGLAIVSHRAEPSASSSWVLSEQPELVAAVHAHLCAVRCEPRSLEEFIEWIAERLIAADLPD